MVMLITMMRHEMPWYALGCDLGCALVGPGRRLEMRNVRRPGRAWEAMGSNM